MVKREFIVERQGRSFVLYAGLLDLAHSQGLRAIRTQVLQLPSEENGQTAVVHAEIETERGTFHGVGDANPSNVARAMLTCTIRLAETRAKARALRDATNVGVAALEELGDLEDAPSPIPQPVRPVATPADTPVVHSTPPTDSATVAQLRAIQSIARDMGLDGEAKSQHLFGVAIADLTRRQASEFITHLKGG